MNFKNCKKGSTSSLVVLSIWQHCHMTSWCLMTRVQPPLSHQCGAPQACPNFFCCLTFQLTTHFYMYVHWWTRGGWTHVINCHFLSRDSAKFLHQVAPLAPGSISDICELNVRHLKRPRGSPTFLLLHNQANELQELQEGLCIKLGSARDLAALSHDIMMLDDACIQPPLTFLQDFDKFFWITE